MSKEYEQKHMEQQIDEVVNAIERIKAESGDGLSVKKLEQIKTSMDTKLKALLDAPKDDVVTFEELGVDELIVDEAHMFKNLRMIDSSKPDLPNSKINMAVENIYRIWLENKEDKLTQLVFCDLLTPRNDGTFNVYDDIKNKLISKGVPEEEIEFIHNAKTNPQKLKLFEDNGNVMGLTFDENEKKLLSNYEKMSFNEKLDIFSELIIRYDNETYFENKIPVVTFSTNVSGFDIAYLIQGKKVQ